jgi:hypothetical protein
MLIRTQLKPFFEMRTLIKKNKTLYCIGSRKGI